MSQIRTIFKNMSWLMISQIITSICAFIWTILIARYLGVSDYGIMGFAVSFTGIIGITMDFGISTHIIRNISTDYDSAPKYLGNAIPLKSIFSIGTFVLTLIILVLMGCDELTITVTFLFTVERIFISMLGLINATFQAFEEGGYQAIINTILNVLLLIFILGSIFFDFGLYGISISYVVANAFVVFYGYYVLKNNITVPKFELDWDFCKKITLYSIPFAVTALFSSIYYSIDMVMITNMVGNYANGIYNAAYKIISVLVVFYGIYGAVIFPVMNKFFKNEKDLLVVIFEKSVKYLMLLMIPLAFSIMLYSTDIIHLIYGNEYLNADNCLGILIWTVCLLFVNGVCTNLLNASHKERFVTIVYITAAIFNLSVNIFLIPKYSYLGASVATVLSDLLILILFLVIIYKMGAMPNRKLIFDLIKIIVSSLILYYVLQTLNVSMWMAIPIGIAIYVVLIVLMRLIDDNDKFIFKEILGM